MIEFKNKLKGLKQILPFIVLFLIALITFWNLGKYALADWDEAIYAEVSRNVLSGHSITLFWGGLDWFHKPPLYFWITAGLFKIIGINEFSARLLSAVSGIGLSYLIYLFAKKLFDKQVGLFSLIFILINSFLLYSFRFGTLDVFSMLLTTLALYFFWLSREKISQIIPSFFFVGLAALTKGPVCLGIILTMFLFALISGELKKYLKSWHFWAGIGLFLALSLPWHIYMYFHHNPAFYNEYYLYQIVKRSKEAIEGHSGNYLFYPSLILRNLSAVIILLGSFLIPKIEFIKKKKEIIFLLMWLLIQYVTIDKVGTKLAWYILPVFVPISILLAYVTAKLSSKYFLIKIALLGIIGVDALLICWKPYPMWRVYDGQQKTKECIQTYSSLNQGTNMLLGFESPTFFFYSKESYYQNLVNQPNVKTNDIILINKTKQLPLNVDHSIIYQNEVCQIVKIK